MPVSSKAVEYTARPPFKVWLLILLTSHINGIFKVVGGE